MWRAVITFIDSSDVDSDVESDGDSEAFVDTVLGVCDSGVFEALGTMR